MRRATLILLLLGSCISPPATVRLGPTPPAPVDVVRVLDELEAAFYDHWGSVESTAPFGRLGAIHVPGLREIADGNGDRALMALRVLARLAPRESFTDDARAIVYASALGRETNFARWGSIAPSGFLPGVYGDELVRIGRPAAVPLQRLLQDARPARVVVGGEAERINRFQGDRVCDYAWVFLAAMLDRPLLYHPDPRRRDPQIRELDLWLDRKR